MKTIGKVIGAFVGVALVFAVLTILSWPVLILSAIGLWYYTKKDLNPKYQKIALTALIFSFFGVLLSLNDFSAEDVEKPAKTEEVATKESVEPKEKKVEEKESVEAVSKEPEPEPEPAPVVQAPAPAPTPEPEPSISIVNPEIVMMTMQESFGSSASIRYDAENKFFIFTVTDENVQSAILATASGLIGRSDWDNLVAQFVGLSGSTKDVLGSGYSIVMENPSNPENYLFLIHDGVLLYNFADEL